MRAISITSALVLAMAAAVTGCTVRQQDLDAWVGQPVAALDTQPVFITMPMYKTVTDGGIEIRNYVNGANIAQCFGTGNAYAGSSSYVNYNQFQNCIATFSACNNIFYIKDGIVQEYAPTPSGRARCFTDQWVLPNKKYL